MQSAPGRGRCEPPSKCASDATAESSVRFPFVEAFDTVLKLASESCHVAAWALAGVRMSLAALALTDAETLLRLRAEAAWRAGGAVCEVVRLQNDAALLIDRSGAHFRQIRGTGSVRDTTPKDLERPIAFVNFGMLLLCEPARWQSCARLEPAS